MPEVLSQQQIDELLGSLQSGDVKIEEIEEKSSSQKVKEYDFRSPKKFTREQLKLLSNIYESFARLFSLQLSSMLRISCQMEVLQVEEEEYREFNNALGDEVLVGIIGLENIEDKLLDKQFLVEIARPVSYAIIDRLLGGDGSGFTVTREYTEIELSIMAYLFEQMVPYLQQAWTNYVELNHSLEMLETNSRLIQFVPPDEAVVIVVLQMTIKELTGNVNICLPAGMLESTFKLFDSKFSKVDRKTDLREQNQDRIMGFLSESPLTVTGTLGNTEILLQELLNLQVGDVIPLDHAVKEKSVEISVEDTPWFQGTLGYHKKKYAIQIDHAIK